MLLWSICWATLNETVTNPCVLQNNPHKALGQRSISLPTERAQAIFCIVTVRRGRWSAPGDSLEPRTATEWPQRGGTTQSLPPTSAVYDCSGIRDRSGERGGRTWGRVEGRVLSVRL